MKQEMRRYQWRAGFQLSLFLLFLPFLLLFILCADSGRDRVSRHALVNNSDAFFRPYINCRHLRQILIATEMKDPVSLQPDAVFPPLLLLHEVPMCNSNRWKTVPWVTSYLKSQDTIYWVFLVIKLVRIILFSCEGKKAPAIIEGMFLILTISSFVDKFCLGT